MKKIIALVLTAFLLLSVIPLAVFAEDDPALDPKNVCYAEDSTGAKTYYTSVKDALKEAPNGSTIVLLRDSSYTGHGTFTSKSLTIDGQGHTLTTSGGYAFDVCGSANNTFTVKNLTVNSARFMYNEFSTVYVENCTVNDSYGLVFSIALPDGVDANINIKDTTINLNTTNNEPFARTGSNIARNCDITFNIQNSDINLTTAKAENSGDSTKACFNLLTAGTVTVNLDATSSMKMAGQYMKTMFHGHDGTGALALNLAEGAEIAINDGVAGVTFITANMSSKTTINDNGAKWIVGAEAAKKGVTLPIITENGDEHSWFDGNTLVTNPYVNALATSETVLNHKVYVSELGDLVKIVDADGNDVATYASLQTAVDALVDGQKIVIIGDYILNTALTFKDTYNKDDLKDIVIEGATKADGKIKVTCANGFAAKVGLYNLTLKNLDIVNNGAEDVFKYMPGVSDFASPTTLVENCTVNAPMSAVFNLNAEVGGNALIKHNPFIVKIKDSTVSGGGAAATSVICVPWNTFASVDLSIENSTVMAVGGNATSPNPETSYVFCFNPIKGGISDFSSTCNVTVDGTSKLIANFTGTATPTGGIFNNIGGTATINLAEGAELYVNSGAEKTKNAFILNTRGTTTINDNGAIWKVGANTAKAGVTLPDIGEDVWYAGASLAANPYMNLSATEDIVLTHGVYVPPTTSPIKIVDANGNDVANYIDLQTAFDALVDGQKIIILEDYTLAAPLTFKGNYDASDLKDVIIEGSGDVTILCANGFAEKVGCYNLTVKNIEINNNGTADVFKYIPGISEFASPTTLVENCMINAPMSAVFNLGAEVGGNTLIKHNPFIVKIKDSTVSAGGSAATSVICVPWNSFASVELSIENSTVRAVGGNATSPNPETSYVFCFNPIKAAVMDLSSTCNITVDGTSKLIANFTGTVTPTGGIFNNIGGTATINLAEGAELYVNNGAEKTNNAFILNTRGTTTINDNGAVWKIGADAAKNGVTLPDNATGTWLVGEAIVVAGEKYINAEATDDVTAVPYDIYDGFSVMQGAGLKVSGDSAGIAFGITVSDELLGILGDDATVGVCILPELFKDMIANEDALSEGWDYIKLGKSVSELTGEGDQNIKFAISGIPVDGSNIVFVDITAIGFVTYTNDAGETVTLYTESYYTTSLYELALKSQNQDSELVKSILAVNA